ncbi:hypothetical protein JRQ81_008862 [Phrynocephalus forsythii]|uniref:Cathepsin L1-like n=1 Tax=Phrynocephalus forsythii TaxID=171643 RepID=A0A9Q0XBB1_9SAUR|nr:hypothetical protein JRQ81_008862 [Phrynocephalus forsythii]
MPSLAASGLLALVTFSAALDPTLDTAWEDWKRLHRKEYLEGEAASRRATWEDNWRMIEQHNWETSQGKHTYRLGMNHFGDLTNEEFNQKMSCLLPRGARPATGNVSVFHGSATQKTPKRVDWREKGYVTPVKDQVGSGFGAAVGALEGLYFKKTGELISLSEQNLVDCAWDLGNRGCQGGWPERALQYVQERDGLSTEDGYPYEGEEGLCRYQPENGLAKCTSVKKVKEGDEKALERAVATVGPVTVAIDARSSALQFYKSGIFSSTWASDALNHAVLAVGYVKNNRSRAYWIIKNSWSSYWGDKGYLYLKKGSNELGVADEACYPE